MASAPPADRRTAWPPRRGCFGGRLPPGAPPLGRFGRAAWAGAWRLRSPALALPLPPPRGAAPGGSERRLAGCAATGGLAADAAGVAALRRSGCAGRRPRRDGNRGEGWARLNWAARRRLHRRHDRRLQVARPPAGWHRGRDSGSAFARVAERARAVAARLRAGLGGCGARGARAEAPGSRQARSRGSGPGPAAVRPSRDLPHVVLHDDVARAADHDQVLDVVAADQDQLPRLVDRRRLQDRHAAAGSVRPAGAGSGPCAA